MADTNIDAFILYNERESAVETIVRELEKDGVSTHFWRRDVPLGDPLNELEEQQLRNARIVLAFLGEAGWGPNHLRLALDAQRLEKRIIPVLIGDAPDKAFEEANALFRDRRYIDLRKSDAASLKQLVDNIRRREPLQTGQINRIVGVLIDGNEEQRADVLRQIRLSNSIDCPALAIRLRTEIQGRFNPSSESEFASAIRDPKKISSIRSWMLSSLIWADAEGSESRHLILRHVEQSFEPDRNVRYWTLAGLYQRESSYLSDAVKVTLDDSAPEVATLALAITSPSDSKITEQLRSKLLSEKFETVWQVLRLLRIVPIPALADTVCEQLDRSASGTALAYDALYALSHPDMARAAVKILLEHPGVEGVVARVVSEAHNSNQNASRNFTVLIAAFDSKEVDSALAAAEQDPVKRDTVRLLRGYLNEYRRPDTGSQVAVAGYASDTVDVRRDPLDIKEDVQTLTAVMLAKEVKPPLAIGLFGDWGTGKSFFMKSMKAAAEDLAGRAGASTTSKFCSNIVSIEFNAWHYVDTNLWASLVSYILEQLAAYVTPQLSTEQQQATLMAELGSAKIAANEAEAEKQRTQKLIADGQNELQRLQLERQQKEIRLGDLRMSDLQTLLEGETTLKEDLENSLEQIGVPAALTSVSELSQVVSEAHTIKGRVMALFLAVLKRENRAVLITLLLFVLFVIPLIAYLLQRFLSLNDLLVSASAFLSQIVGIIIGITAILRKAVTITKTNLEKVERAKKRVDELIAEKKRNPTEDEIKLQKEIAGLKAKEQEEAARLSIAAARILELEERIRALKEGRSLARFLAERTRSEDYRKHLGLISTIRQDFESLADRLTHARTSSGERLRPVDRIILYIDDLDRCPADKVLEVLQAVHLLLAYPLFVVVVGVDPRWLLHSLGTTYSAFQSDGGRFSANPDLWRTTPQNYLEKIFQIPFSLRPMTSKGYEKLIEGLFQPTAALEPEIPSTVPPHGDTHTPAQQTPTSVLKEAHKPEPSLATVDSTQTTSSIDAEGGGQTPSEDEKPRFVINEESLAIKPWEAKFAERLYALVPTPRAAKRFSNVYRILKAPVQRDRLAQFEGSAEVPGDFQVPMLLLAILIGAPVESALLFPKLLQYANEGHDLKKALQRFETLDLNSDSFKSLEEKIRAILTGSDFPDTPEVFLEWIPRVSRFSFDLGRVIQPFVPN